METRLARVHPHPRLRLAIHKVAAARRQLEALNYRSVLKRGFSVTRQTGGKILRSVRNTDRGEGIETELADGRILSIVEKIHSATRLSADPPKPRPTRKQDDRQPTLFDEDR